MKKRIGFLLFFVALFATTQIQAQQNNLVVNNGTNCQYTINVYVAASGGCAGSYTVSSVTIPPGFSGSIFTSIPGEWVVGTDFFNYGFGLSNPIGFACNAYPPNNSFVNFCGVPVTANYTQATTITSPSTLNIF